MISPKPYENRGQSRCNLAEYIHTRMGRVRERSPTCYRQQPVRQWRTHHQHAGAHSNKRVNAHGTGATMFDALVVDANNPPQRQRQRDNCTRQECVARKRKIGGMARAIAMMGRELDALRAQDAMRDVHRAWHEGNRQQGAAAGVGVMGAGHDRVEPNQNGIGLQEARHMMRSRLRALRALVEEHIERAKQQGLVGPLEKTLDALKLQLDGASDTEHDTVYEQAKALEHIITNARVKAAPFECTVCLEEIKPNALFLGKNCFHFTCSGCVLSMGQTKARPIYRRDTDPIWEDITPHEDAATWVVREDATNTFPVGTWVHCPECRKDYTDNMYYDFVVSCRATIDEGIEDEIKEEPTEVIDRIRRNGWIRLVEVPDEPDKVMMVSAKVPRTPVEPTMPRDLVLSNYLEQMGFKFGSVGEGRANWKMRSEDDVVDGVPFGATLRMTVPRAVEVHEECGRDEDGAPLLKKVKRVPQGARGTYKIDLIIA